MLGYGFLLGYKSQTRTPTPAKPMLKPTGFSFLWRSLDEVDEPASFHDYGLEFVPQTALAPCQPWLTPHLSIMVPLSKIVYGATEHAKNSNSVSTDLGLEDEFPDHINISDSDEIPDHLIIPDSDSSPTSQIHFPLSDDEDQLSDPMDVVRSDEQSAKPHGAVSAQEVPTPVLNTDSESDLSSSDHIVFPSDISGSPGVVAGFGHDPNTGRFTVASFAHFPDELLD